MKIAGRFRAVRHKDRVFSGLPPKQLSYRGGALDIRFIPWDKSKYPLLLVSASRKTGRAADRNKFRRRVRMAFLDILRKYPDMPDNGYVLWVRPASGNLNGCLIAYQDIEKQLALTLSRLRHP